MLFWRRNYPPPPPVPGTARDEVDMKRMNKVQKLNRVYGVTTLVGYGVILGLTWPFSLITGTLSLTNGGPAGAIWVFLGTCAGMITVVISMAEMASIEPTTGGQYHWVSIFAPPKYRKILSYMVGWMCALGWQSGVAGSANVGALSMQGFIALIDGPSYHAKPWHLVLLTIAILVFVVLFNVFVAKKLPGIEGLVFVLYLLAFIAFLLVLFIMGDRSTAKTVFTDFQDNAGWGSIGTACFVGISGPVITIIGGDSVVHLAEELKDASRQLPKAMVSMALINYLVGFLMLLAFVFVVGNVQEVLATPTGQPYIQVIWNATQSKGPTIVMVAIVIFFFIFTAINVNVTASRQIWAFARDGGLPFSRWISYVSPYMHIPTHAIGLSWFIGCCIALIPLGSNAAFLNIQTIGNGGLLSSYIICIGCRLYHRNAVGVYGNLSSRPPFCLPKLAGNILNVVALCVLVVFLVSNMFPVTPNPTPSAMNWTSAALAGTVFLALTMYIRLYKNYLLSSDVVERSSSSDSPRDVVVVVDSEMGLKGYDVDKGGIPRGY